MIQMPTEAEPVVVVEGDCREVSLPAFDQIVTSPPYWDLRDGTGIGSESTADGYVRSIVGVFHGLRRRLSPAGTAFLNLGDTYRAKRLQGIPWRVALALQDDGWVLRSEVIWEKSNHKPEKAKDRPTRSHEHLFVLTRRGRYFWDWRAEAEAASGTDARPQYRRAKQLASEKGLTHAHLAAIRATGATDAGKAVVTQDGTGRNSERVKQLAVEAKSALGGYFREFLLSDVRNCRTVWRIPADRSLHAHTAPMPVALAAKCIRLGCPPGGVVFDPFGGSGTTGVAAITEGRRALLVEVDPESIAIARRRVREAMGTGLLAVPN